MKQYNIKFLRFLILHYIFVFIVFTTYAENFLEPQLSKYQENFVINVFLNLLDQSLMLLYFECWYMNDANY